MGEKLKKRLSNSSIRSSSEDKPCGCEDALNTNKEKKQENYSVFTIMMSSGK